MCLCKKPYQPYPIYLNPASIKGLAVGKPLTYTLPTLPIFELVKIILLTCFINSVLILLHK